MENSTNKKRLNIGLAIDNISMVGGQKALRGIASLAEKHDFNFLCYHLNLNDYAEKLPPAWDSIGEVLDGLVIFQAWQSEEKFNLIRNRFPSLPMVNAARLYKGCPGVAPDSYGGMKKLIAHLIEEHNCSKIAIIQGPEGNWPAQERSRAYEDALKEHGIPLDKKLVSPNVAWWEGDDAMAVLLKERQLKPGVDFQAIIGANDSLALSAIKVLQEMDISIPGDVHVTGFDDDPRGSFSSPPLTTAEFNMGEHATLILLDMLAGKAVPDSSFAPTDIVIRRSCGCISDSVKKASFFHTSHSEKKSDPVNPDPEQISAVVKNMSNYYNKDEAEIVRPWIDKLVNSLLSALETGDIGEINPYLLTLENTLHKIIKKGLSLQNWQNIISVFRRQLLPYLGKTKAAQAESLWQQSRITVEEIINRIHTSRIFDENAEIETLRDIEQTMLTDFRVNALMKTLSEHLPRLGIPECFLSLYDHSEQQSSNDKKREWSLLRTTIKNSGLSSGETSENGSKHLRFPTDRLVPEGMLPAMRFSAVIEPLYFQEQQLGFIVFETGPLFGPIYDSLRGSISTALQGSLLMERVQDNAAQLNSVVNQTVTTSEEMLATISEMGKQALIVSNTAQTSVNETAAGKEAVADTVTGMQTIQHQVKAIADSILALTGQTKQIEKILTVVEDIVGQSEVLAINASIQAARAGKQGLGFAVVAKEMRKLAEQSMSATANIGDILEEIRIAAKEAVAASEEGSHGVSAGMTLAGRAGEAINNLADTIRKASSAAEMISASTAEQSNAMEQLVYEVKSIKEASDIASQDIYSGS